VIGDDRHEGLLATLALLAPSRPPLERICQGCVELLQVSGAAVVLMSSDEAGSVAASFGARVAEVEDLQFALGEGPCLDSFERGQPVLEPDLSSGPQDRWPMFRHEAAAIGARAVFVLPIQLGAIRVGVLYLYRTRPGQLSPRELADALDLAELALMAVLELQGQVSYGPLGTGLEGEWANRAVVHQATGMVAAQLDVRLAVALARIRAHAFAAEMTIYDVATALVSGRLQLPA